METSLRYSGDSKALRIHAKEKFSIDSKTHLQVYGELDTRTGAPSNFCAMIRHFYPDLHTSLGVGLRYDKCDKVQYTLRGKRSFLVTNNGLVNFVVKGRYDVDQEFEGRKSEGAAEFTFSIINFQRDQDVRFKLGYEVSEKVPYLQIRENNWTLDVDMKGRWNIRFDL
ncbi:outer envelope pore protein 21, chloroplastic-like isoform X1 [Durio zibethinus]|uniref:Outer envelope pore protein 21, chloroplastic-like isoform X1 n=1 Tax=Durio zibethinus TaxID=66656 RepID=A0A6P5X3B4_DURZI|nr:outer envelope pore protein 21, chloroplastic-like isoform X1 [Durio zibethinus]